MDPDGPRPPLPGGTGKGHVHFRNSTGQSISSAPGKWGVLTILDQFQSPSQHLHHHCGTPRDRACFILSSHMAAAEAVLVIWTRQRHIQQWRHGFCGGGGCGSCRCCRPCPQSLSWTSPPGGKWIPAYVSLAQNNCFSCTLPLTPWCVDDAGQGGGRGRSGTGDNITGLQVGHQR